MKTAFDTNGILFRLLHGNTSANGGVYVEDDRPDNSEKEDIVVNSIDLGQDALPQVGTSNSRSYSGIIVASGENRRKDASSGQSATAQSHHG